MAKLTVKELLELKGVRQIAFVQVAQAEEAIAASAAGMDMVGTGFRLETREFANLALIERDQLTSGTTCQSAAL